MPELSPLLETVSTTATDLWNDSCALSELEYAIEHGAVGATSNPTIVLQVLRKELSLWRERLAALPGELPSADERALTWRLIEEMAQRAAKLLLPIFERTGGRAGRLSLQTDPTRYRDAAALLAQAEHFHGLAPNIQVKIPATRAGIEAIEQATARGIHINATVCFTVPQALAVAEAVQRGLARLDAATRATMTPVCTIMVGRLDDWLKVVAARDDLAPTPGVPDWAGIAAIKRAGALYAERGYSTRLLAAAYRHHGHWSELIGGDVILTIPHGWQRVFNASDIEVKARWNDPVPPAALAELTALFSEFRRAYEPDGLAIEEFEHYGAARRTLRGFIASYDELVSVVRDAMLPDPDKETV
ncbi:MAG: transaldolase family protein [Myxococcales bacterium]|nr:transaldolase family protein [Myxococcales bacterium]